MKPVLLMLLVVSFCSFAGDPSGKGALDQIDKEFGELRVDKKVAKAFDHIFQEFEEELEADFKPITKQALSAAGVQPKTPLFTAYSGWEVVGKPNN
jgi:hypothetical protein